DRVQQGSIVSVHPRPVKRAKNFRKFLDVARSLRHDRDDVIRWCEARLPAGPRLPREAKEEVSPQYRRLGDPAPATRAASLSDPVRGGPSPSASLPQYVGL